MRVAWLARKPFATVPRPGTGQRSTDSLTITGFVAVAPQEKQWDACNIEWQTLTYLKDCHVTQCFSAGRARKTGS